MRACAAQTCVGAGVGEQKHQQQRRSRGGRAGGRAGGYYSASSNRPIAAPIEPKDGESFLFESDTCESMWESFGSACYLFFVLNVRLHQAEVDAGGMRDCGMRDI